MKIMVKFENKQIKATGKYSHSHFISLLVNIKRKILCHCFAWNQICLFAWWCFFVCFVLGFFEYIKLTNIALLVLKATGKSWPGSENKLINIDEKKCTIPGKSNISIQFKQIVTSSDLRFSKLYENAYFERLTCGSVAACVCTFSTQADLLSPTLVFFSRSVFLLSKSPFWQELTHRQWYSAAVTVLRKFMCKIISYTYA